MIKLASALLLSALLSSCATTKGGRGDPETFKKGVEALYENFRWKDFRAAAPSLVPEKRDAFLAARKKHNDDKDLTITEYTLHEVRFNEDATKAKLVTEISWFRLPSPSQHSDTVENEFVWKDGVWLLERQDAGPFVPELNNAP